MPDATPQNDAYVDKQDDEGVSDAMRRSVEQWRQAPEVPDALDRWPDAYVIAAPARDAGEERAIGPHTHVWTFLHNARAGWLWHCHCGAYRNNDGRVSEPHAR